MDGKCIEMQACSRLLMLMDNTSEERGDLEEDPTSEDWREKILLNANPQQV